MKIHGGDDPDVVRQKVASRLNADPLWRWEAVDPSEIKVDIRSPRNWGWSLVRGYPHHR